MLKDKDQINSSSEFSPLGRHFIVDYWACDKGILNDEKKLVDLINEAAKQAGACVLSSNSHNFDGQGVTAVSVLAESHISIHTWPEFNYAGVDIYTCGDCQPLIAHTLIAQALSSERHTLLELERGMHSPEKSISVSGSSKDAYSGLSDDRSWFFEGHLPGRRDGNISHGFAIDKLVIEQKTQFQDYLIFDTPLYGRVLALDGIVQFSTSDEYIYHDMLIHPVMFTHPNPKNILIVGGGDGAALREVLRHNPDQVVMIDIDEQFVRGAAKHLPSLHAGAFEDPRLKIIFEDASTALDQFEGVFDVAIIDCNDAVGTSKPLFEEKFYSSVARSLKEDAVCAVQAGSTLDMDFLVQTRERVSSYLGKVNCFKLTLPSYHCGEYVFMTASKSHDSAKVELETLVDRQSQREIVTKYWSPAMHFASQVFPPSSPLGEY